MNSQEFAKIFSSKESYLLFLKKQHEKVHQDFNDASKPENKATKWKLLRIEKVMKLIRENPDYQLGYCFNCGKILDQKRLQREPESIWCVPCVTKHEKKFRHRGGHWAFSSKPKGGDEVG
ncbi:MAG TPA: hypothetical protein ENN28_00655 [Candidatus Uhrbacteria bacterium]|nr:hypothetical protein [Candidatus Uhrbacteria bacterium]